MVIVCSGVRSLDATCGVDDSGECGGGRGQVGTVALELACMRR